MVFVGVKLRRGELITPRGRLKFQRINPLLVRRGFHSTSHHSEFNQNFPPSPNSLRDIIRRDMRRILFLCFSGLLAAGAALAEDFWVNKEYMQWSDAEVKKLMTNSPWAKEITLNAPLAALGSRGQRPSAPAFPA